MARVETHHGIARNTRAAPVAHDAALQEAKRLEKMQTVCSSHRTAGTSPLPVILTKDATR